MRNGSPFVEYCMELLRRGSDAFTQFIDILIETKQKWNSGFAFTHYLESRLRRPFWMSSTNELTFKNPL